MFERSWLCAGHEPALAAHSGGGWPTADASPAAGELPAQPTRAKTATRAAPKTATPALAHRILFVNDMVARLPSSLGTCRKVAARAAHVFTASARSRPRPAGIPTYLLSTSHAAAVPG